MRCPPNVAVLASAALALAVSGCDAPDPTSLESHQGAAASAIVAKGLQYRFPVRLTFLDDQNNWDVALLGYDPADDEVCNGGAFVGGIPVLEHITVTHADESFDLGDRSTWGRGEGLHDLVTTIGRPPMYMYSRASLPPGNATDAEWCEYLMQGWMAAGSWSATIAIDNDVTGDDGTPGIDTWGGIENGVLVGTDGTLYRYEWKFRALYDPDVRFNVVNLVDHVVRIGQ